MHSLTLIVVALTLSLPILLTTTCNTLQNSSKRKKANYFIKTREPRLCKTPECVSFSTNSHENKRENALLL
ncbi:hypothetical protein Ciccas_004938 [Cichlidogyrus casuarinus]|uniref:Secreted protein n=1 Tax=Cichlidogyrus casuarinus TaxID=1844966 RepID=A0ABD2QCE6_9PLAT